MKKLILIMLGAVFLTSCFSLPVSANDDLEENVCGIFWAEDNVFAKFKKIAGKVKNPSDFIKDFNKKTNISSVSFNTRDGFTLKGYKLSTKQQNKGYLLFVQGNAMLADQMLESFTDYTTHGYDVYIYDFRGYGDSNGNSKLKAIVDDYKNIVIKLNTQYTNKKHLLYGMSFGGLVLLKGLKDANITDNNMRVVIDNNIPEIPWYYLCPSEYDPDNNMPTENIKEFMFFVGEQDSISAPRESFIKNIENLGINVKKSKNCSHGVSKKNTEKKCTRFDVIKNFLIK